MKLKISRAAQLDLEHIWEYTLKNWSLEQADRYYNLILDEIAYLANQPNSGKDYSALRKDYFRVRIKSHFIFYRINRGLNVIEIIRILHERMDVDTFL
jgi:toxin ParE1/3/4